MEEPEKVPESESLAVRYAEGTIEGKLADGVRLDGMVSSCEL